MNILLIILFCISCLYESCLNAVVIGSETAVSIITTSTVFPVTDTDNMMLGFGWFQGGFTLQDLNTSCTFNSVYPVSGTVDMNGGTLYLSQDLTLANVTQLNGLGTIIGNGHSIEFCESVTLLPANLKLIKDLNIFLNDPIECTSTVTVQGNCQIISNGAVLDLTSGRFIIDTNSSLLLQNMRVSGVGNDNISCVDDTGHLILNNLIVSLSGDMHFIYGNILFQNTVSIMGNYVYWYDSAQSSEIDDKSTLSFDGGSTIQIGRKIVGGPDPLIFYGDESVLACGECTFMVTGSGIGLQRGRVELNKNVIIDVASSDTTCGIILGNGIDSTQDITLYLGAGSNTVFQSGALTYNNVAGNKFYSASPTAHFTRDINSYFNMATTCTFPSCVLEYQLEGVNYPPMTFASGGQLYYDQTRILVPGFWEGTLQGQCTPQHSFILDNNASIYITSGVFPENIEVIGSNNIISGNGSLIGAITFQDAGSQLTLNFIGILTNTISLNNGTLILNQDTGVLSPNCFSSSGTIDLNQFTLSYYYTNTTAMSAFVFDTPLTWSGDNGRISFSDDTSLSSTWTFQGMCTIDGNGKSLNFVAGGQFIIDSGAWLTLRNIRLTDIGTEHITCIDNTSKLILDNVQWIQNEDFLYNAGSIDIKHNVIMSGEGYVFTYQSTQTCSVYHDSSLTFDYNFTFSYAPTNEAQTLLTFQDNSSRLIMNSSTLYLYPGLQLIKGQWKISQSPTIYALDGGLQRGTGGLTLGDGTSQDDMQLVCLDSSELSIAAGALNYRNIQTDSIQLSESASLLIASNVSLNIFENLSMNARVIFEQDSTYAYTGTTSLLASIVSLGKYNEVIIV